MAGLTKWAEHVGIRKRYSSGTPTPFSHTELSFWSLFPELPTLSPLSLTPPPPPEIRGAVGFVNKRH